MKVSQMCNETATAKTASKALGRGGHRTRGRYLAVTSLFGFGSQTLPAVPETYAAQSTAQQRELQMGQRNFAGGGGVYICICTVPLDSGTLPGITATESSENYLSMSTDLLRSLS